MEPQLVINIVSFSGKRCTGKTTALDMMKAHLGNVEECAFAYRVKTASARKMCDGQVVNLSYEQVLEKLLHDREFKELHRHLMIEIGNGERAKDPNIWVSQTCSEIQSLINNLQLFHSTGQFYFCITDMRFKNEYNYVKNFFSNLSAIFKSTPMSAAVLNVHFFRLSSSDDVRISRGWKYDPKVDGDVSECDLDDFETCCPDMKEIHNNSTPLEFYENLYDFLC